MGLRPIAISLDIFNRLLFGCVCPHTAQIGNNVSLGYGGLGIVIHRDAFIGDRTEIGSGVVVGGNASEYGVPKIGCDVYIGAGAKVLGPISVGDGAIIGANAVVLRDVAPNSLVVGVPARPSASSRSLEAGLAHRRQ